MAKPYRPKFETQDYVLESERELPEAEQTVWKIRGLSLEDFTTASDMATRDEKASACIFAARRGIVGWTNFGDVEFEGRLYPQDKDRIKRAKPEEIAEIEPVTLMAIGAEVINISRITDTEKN